MATSVALATRGVITSCNNETLALVTRGLEVICEPAYSPTIDPNLPIHITDVFPGMQIRISLKPGTHLEKRVTKNGEFLVPTNVRSSRRGYEKSVLAGTVTANYPNAGQLSMTVTDEVYCKVFKADVPYSFMGIAQRIVPITELVETASSPGSVALGSKLVGGTLMNPRFKLVPIKF